MTMKKISKQENIICAALALTTTAMIYITWNLIF